MSSILNALKKLESEAPPRSGDAAPSLHRAMNVRRTLHNRFQKARLIRGLLLALTGVLVLAVGLGLYVNRRQLPIIKGFYPAGQPRPEPERLASVSEPPAMERSVQPAPAPRKPPAPPKKRPVRRPVRAAAPEPITPAPAPEPPAAKPDVPRSRPSAATAPPASSPPSPPERTPAAGVEMSDLAVRTAPPVEPAPAPTPTGDPNETPPAAGVPPRLANVVQRSDPRFHIQALVWSPAPEGRMAMVNGNIVKTGGVVDDARIIHIGETFLIFQENGNRWRHPFRVK